MSRLTDEQCDSVRLKWKGIRGWDTLKEPLSDAWNSLLTLVDPRFGRQPGLNGLAQPCHGLPDLLKQGGGGGQESPAVAGFSPNNFYDWSGADRGGVTASVLP